GELEKARETLEKAAAIEPEDPSITEHLGDVHRALGNDEQALYYYRKSLDLDNSDEYRRTIREKIDAIQQP
ncbi:MAG TPA: tetratricopeptide repeat protein, partial [Desulfopila sp.]|nr:tetratricopeptide repeat protein [Desulfopila sp.]